MPPKITDSRPSPEAINEMEEQTASGARRIVATYAEDFFDGVTLMSMLGVEPKGFNYKKYAEEILGDEDEDTSSSSTKKKATKKKASKKKATKKKASKKKATKKKATKKKATKKKATKKKTAKKS